MEAELDYDSGLGHLPAAEVSLPVLLACLCRLVEFDRVGISDVHQVLVSDYGGVSSGCRRSAGIPGTWTTRLRTLRAWAVRGCWSAGWKVLVGIESRDVRGSLIIGNRLYMECMATSSGRAGRQ